MSLLRRRILTGGLALAGNAGFRGIVFSLSHTSNVTLTVSLTRYGTCAPTLKYASSNIGGTPISVSSFHDWDYSAISVTGRNPTIYIIGENPSGISTSASNYCTFDVNVYV